LPTPLRPGDQTTLQIAFSVTVPRLADYFGYEEGVMSLGYWYPILAVYDDEGWNLDQHTTLGEVFYSDVGFYTVRITAPEDVVIAATGVEVSRVLHRPPRMTVTYVSQATRDFSLALSREYQSVSAQVGETTVTSYYLPQHETGGQRALQVATDALEVFNARFGLYPYTELDVAETFLSGGMEFPGLVFIGSNFYPVVRPSIFGIDMLVAHEVAHQWWYGVVGNNQADEPWLDESFATYSSLLYFQEVQGERAAEAVRSEFIDIYLMAAESGNDGPLQSLLQDYAGKRSAYQSVVYFKGALFLARLREILGDDDFFALMQHHYQTHKYGLLAADNFRQSIEQTTENAEALEFYDAIVVRGEAIEDLD
jgi:aminopeptidase N